MAAEAEVEQTEVVIEYCYMSQDSYPLLSALMLIYRPDPKELIKAINCFEAQTYPYKELIIIKLSISFGSFNSEFVKSEINWRDLVDLP